METFERLNVQRLNIVGLGLAWLGYWAPWIAHRAAALNLNGYELAEWITRLPAGRDGSLPLSRIDFLAPLAALAALSALFARVLRLPRPARWGLRLAALFGAIALLDRKSVV